MKKDILYYLERQWDIEFEGNFTYTLYKNVKIGDVFEAFYYSDSFNTAKETIDKALEQLEDSEKHIQKLLDKYYTEEINK